MERILIAIGSNLGDSVQICVAAIERLRKHPDLQVLGTSSLYRTSPLMHADQPWFINGVVLGETALLPQDLLRVIQEMEQDFGRDRQIRWGPRTLDLDLLAYGDHEVNLPELTIPHPQLHQRRFVLEPLLEIAPDWVHPTLNVSVRDLLHRLSDEGGNQEVQRLETS
jgi:2-amino-4-hydroxy-6-hydroxymethyldihydropteridine diphosphokinase